MWDFIVKIWLLIVFLIDWLIDVKLRVVELVLLMVNLMVDVCWGVLEWDREDIMGVVGMVYKLFDDVSLLVLDVRKGMCCDNLDFYDFVFLFSFLIFVNRLFKILMIFLCLVICLVFFWMIIMFMIIFCVFVFIFLMMVVWFCICFRRFMDLDSWEGRFVMFDIVDKRNW